MITTIVQHFVGFAQLHPANMGALIIVGLLVMMLIGLVKLGWS